MLSSLRGRRAGPWDRAYDAAALLALPAPHLVRAVVAGLLVIGVIASATVASAEAIPDDPLYAVKLATEDLRLRLAQTAEDRAAVELSMAEHRFSEAERLAEAGRAPDAVVAASTYGLELANAAAELASADAADPRSRAALEQLRLLLSQQQKRAGDAALHLATDPRNAPAAPVFRTVASAAPRAGLASSEEIAQHAAAVTEQLVQVAGRLPAPVRVEPTPATRPPSEPAPAAPAPKTTEAQPGQDPAPANDLAPAKLEPGKVEPAKVEPAKVEHGGAHTTVERTRRNADKAAEAAHKAKVRAPHR